MIETVPTIPRKLSIAVRVLAQQRKLAAKDRREPSVPQEWPIDRSVQLCLWFTDRIASDQSVKCCLPGCEKLVFTTILVIRKNICGEGGCIN